MARTEIADTTETLRADLDALKTDMGALVDTLKKVAKEGGEEGMKNLREFQSQARVQATQSVQAVERQITENPLTSILVAFGAGMVIGKLMDRH